MVDSFLLLNTGDYVLLNDGTSRVLLNTSTDSTGVIIEGTHPRPVIGGFDPAPKRKQRKRQFELIALGKITRTVTKRSEARLLRITESIAKSRLSHILTESARSRLLRTYECNGAALTVDKAPRARTIKVYECNAMGKVFNVIHDKVYEDARKLEQHKKQVRIDRLKKAFEQYKKEEESDEL